MRVLIAYDGSKGAEAAIDDLALAGLPENGSVQILSVGEVCLPQLNGTNGTGIATTPAVNQIATTFKKYGEQSITEATMFARHAEIRVKKMLPNWEVLSASKYGSPAREILDTAQKFGPDLIVVGSNGHGSFASYLLGSISQKVLTEAHCSVRIARGKVEVDGSLNRIVIGFDGSDGAFAAVRGVAGRNWIPGSEIHIVTASEPAVPDSVGRFVIPTRRPGGDIDLSDRRLFEQVGSNALELLRESGIKAVLHIRPGSPKQVLVQEAERLGADCIFVGASSSANNSDRFLPGSTSTAIAARAHCSVEVVREIAKNDSEMKELAA
jgi:nucleotide-binding universal stress UspA family protein